MDLSSAALHLLAGKYFQIAAFVMLAYDHLITLGQEVETIWMRPISVASMLFLFNRYATLMQFIIIVVGKLLSSLAVAFTHVPIAFNDPGWKGEAYVPPHKRFNGCQLKPTFKARLFQYGAKPIYLPVGQLIMILRVVAVYQGSQKVFTFLLFLWTGQIIISAVGLRTGFVVPLPPGLVGCILTGSGTLFPSVWIAPLVTDSFIFLLTIYRTGHNIGHFFTSFASGGITDRAVTLLLRDGVVYYFLILIANLMNALLYFLAEPDIKPIGASFSQLLTSTVLSRLVLNLRSLSSRNQGHTTGGTMLQFDNQRYEPNRLDTTPPKQLEILWTRTLNDFTEDGSSCTFEVENVALEVLSKPEGVTHHANDDDGHPCHEV
ncbi:hypothetical protein AGABI1DRAFT_131716 [Agaricus bisporus var. burnettii JB137-S8]|uniref:DUF6533 domain-containing protein n=1 Tax=Agaricus bisporus var. burnettii (strain JB137-S8 / ATCC MYA-4627 / FGSC 10392) TaxID=597362 RepID=K5WYU0_AGABU|nr:uncharacterized protein AGABI1DRAFT_131716 [Agaricus bisporus var. burnettii JB137-S8]EKM75998.1 hypothetical protein AGABI1DRAFT_131716 [Agaricus bisporus var. burnettii JB137-S8]